MVGLGEDPTREGLIDTPDRVAKAWQEFICYDPGRLYTTFEAVTTDQMVIVDKIKCWSFCEHHLLPFWCNVSIGYIAQENILGLSKFARIVNKHAHRLQLQERLITQIADDLVGVVGENVAVYATGQHLCMSMRGVRSDATMKSSVMRGVFFNNSIVRKEFLSLIHN